MPEKFDLSEYLPGLTLDPEATTKILKYIDQQHGPTDKRILHYDMEQLLNMHLTPKDTDGILARVHAYSQHYRRKILELIAS